MEPRYEGLLQLFFVPSMKEAKGSDWGRGYYASHACHPDSESTQIIVWNHLEHHYAPLVGPGGPHYGDSCPLSVNAINKGAAAWLTYQDDNGVIETFKGGDTLEDCVGRLKKLGFIVYREVEDEVG